MSRPVPGVPSVLYDERRAELDLAEERRRLSGLSIYESLVSGTLETYDAGEDYVLRVLRGAGY